MSVPDVSRRSDLPPIRLAPRNGWRDGNPNLVAYCATCRCNTIPNWAGVCLFCDSKTIGRTQR